MIRTSLFLSLVLAFLGISACKGKDVKNQELIREVFNNYKTEVVNGGGNKALSYLHPYSFDYYTKLLLHINRADSAQLSHFSSADKLLVLAFRQLVPEEVLKTQDVKDLLAFTGILLQPYLGDCSIGEVNVEQDFAQGRLLFNGRTTPFYFHFYKQSGSWKMDLGSVSLSADTLLKQMMEQTGLSEPELLGHLLSKLSGFSTLILSE